MAEQIFGRKVLGLNFNKREMRPGAGFLGCGVAVENLSNTVFCFSATSRRSTLFKLLCGTACRTWVHFCGRLYSVRERSTRQSCNWAVDIVWISILCYAEEISRVPYHRGILSTVVKLFTNELMSFLSDGLTNFPPRLCLEFEHFCDKRQKSDATTAS